MKVEPLSGDIEIVIRTVVNPSESVEKVRQALERIFLGSVRFELEGVEFVARSKGYAVLEEIYRQIRARGTISTTRRLLRRNSRDDSTFLYLNKQAAFVGTVALCDDESESPLGPIVLEIRSTRLEGVIDWLSPRVE